jgi:hypothetical protein
MSQYGRTVIYVQCDVRIAIVVVLAGCSFRTNQLAADAADAADTGPDARTIDARMFDAPPPFCDPTDATLIACYEFENTTDDASGHNLNASNTGVTYVTGKLGMAAHAIGATQMNVMENPLLDPAAVTIEAWIKAPIPASGRAGILDNDGQYGFFLQPGGALQGIGLTSAANVPDNTWTHVAMTYDGTTRHYVNGVEVGATAGGGATLSTGGTNGISIGADNPPGAGSPLNGDIDQLRIFSVARTPGQIAVDATP